MNKLQTLETKIEAAREKLKAMEEQYQALRLETLKQVEITKNGDTITLRFNGRVIKAKKNSYGRYKVWEGDRVLNRDYTWGIHDLRFALASGQF
jgi:hypothetical protein